MSTLDRTQTGININWKKLGDDSVLEPLFVGLTLAGIIAGVLLEQLGAGAELILAVGIATYVFGGYYAVREIIDSLKEWSIEVDLLMVLAALGAAYVGAWVEGAILLFLFSLSNVLQNYSMGRTRQAIAKLLELRPDRVMVRQGDQLIERPIDDVTVGELIVLRPGDRVPLDGTILRGNGNLDESALTGESMPVSKGKGAMVLAGTLNINGAFDIEVSKPATDSTLARIIAMVGDAQSRKARTQSFLEQAEQYYAIGVIIAVALYIALVPTMFGTAFADSFYNGMVLLTVASPCALVISVPAALLSGIANAARQGILFKGGAYLETLSQMKVVAFDKTGTLTHGKPELNDLLPVVGVSERELLEVAARAEAPSEHPIARSILARAEREGVQVSEPEQFEAITGKGVRTSWDGEETLVGSLRLFDELGIPAPSELQDQAEQLMDAGRGTVLIVRRGERWLGLIAVMDRAREDAAEQIKALRAAGVERIVMLTGDNPRVAGAIADRLGIDEVHAGLLPEDKLRIVGELRERYGQVAMVGDGVNDAPALAEADIGIAMGGAGTDAALETADAVLMSDNLGALVNAFKLSTRTRRVVWQNISFALAVVVVLVITTLTVGVPLPIGVVGHEGSTILVVLNGLRLLGGTR
jgi:Cd2+/Zn2+-exporting ATPase